jgi:hypothetical protein
MHAHAISEWSGSNSASIDKLYIETRALSSTQRGACVLMHSCMHLAVRYQYQYAMVGPYIPAASDNYPFGSRNKQCMRMQSLSGQVVTQLVSISYTLGYT